MNIKALVTTLALLGSTSSALARPLTTFGASAEVSATVRLKAPVTQRSWLAAEGTYRAPLPEHRNERSFDYGPARHFDSYNTLTADASVYKGPVMLGSPYGRSHRWSAVTAPTRIEQGRQYVTDLGLSATSHVRLVGVQGRTNVSQVLIRFTDGSEQLVQINRSLRGGSSIDIAIQGSAKGIHGFVLYGETSKSGAYQILVR